MASLRVSIIEKTQNNYSLRTVYLFIVSDGSIEKDRVCDKGKGLRIDQFRGDSQLFEGSGNERMKDCINCLAMNATSHDMIHLVY